MDETFTWAPHICHIKSKIAKGIGIISKAKRLLNTTTLLTLYYSFVYPYFNYALEVWGDTYVSYLTTLIRLQKRIIRIISSSSRLEHTAPLFKQLKVLQLKKVHQYKVGLVMFKVWHFMAPDIFCSLFVRNQSVHSYNTRQYLQFHVPPARTDYMKRSISYKGVSIWNEISSKITVDCSYLSFKHALRKYILDSETDT